MYSFVIRVKMYLSGTDITDDANIKHDTIFKCKAEDSEHAIAKIGDIVPSSAYITVNNILSVQELQESSDE